MRSNHTEDSLNEIFKNLNFRLRAGGGAAGEILCFSRLYLPPEEVGERLRPVLVWIFEPDHVVPEEIFHRITVNPNHP